MHPACVVVDRAKRLQHMVRPALAILRVYIGAALADASVSFNRSIGIFPSSFLQRFCRQNIATQYNTSGRRCGAFYNKINHFWGNWKVPILRFYVWEDFVIPFHHTRPVACPKMVTHEGQGSSRAKRDETGHLNIVVPLPSVAPTFAQSGESKWPKSPASTGTIACPKWSSSPRPYDRLSDTP